MADYPSSIPSFDTITPSQTLATASHSSIHNSLAEEVTAIATELGVNAAGSFTTVRDRLESLELGTSAEATLDNLSATTVTAGTLNVDNTSAGNINCASITVASFKAKNAVANLTVTALQVTTLTGLNYVAIAGNATYSSVAAYATVAGTATVSSYATNCGTATTASMAVTLTANSILGAVTITTASITNLTAANLTLTNALGTAYGGTGVTSLTAGTLALTIENRTDDTGCTQTGRIWLRTDV